MNRRGFLERSLLWGLGIFSVGCLAEALVVMYRFLMPSQRRRYFKTYASSLPSLSSGEAREIRLRGNRLMLINNGGAITAFSARCPHLGCNVMWDPRRMEFLCPCHLAVFDVNGQVLKGPPPRPLDQYKVAIEGSSIFVFVPENYWAQLEA